MKKAPNLKPVLLSARSIARRIHRSPSGVSEAIQRLGIQPDVSTPMFAYYLESRVPQIIAGMRSPNGSKSQG